MKQFGILFLLILSLYSCKKDVSTVRISGEIKGLGTDTLYMYGMDELYDRIDTIYVEEGKFSHSVKVDTITPVYLLINAETEYPLFLDKGNSIKIKGDTTNLNLLTVDGNSYNEDFTVFQKTIAGLTSPTEKMLEDKAEEYILQHHSSYLNLYLLDQYFVRKEQPDFARINKLMEVLPGVLLDKPYIEKINEKIKQTEKIKVGNYSPYFNLSNAKGEKISRSAKEFNNKCLLLNFWASWADSTALKKNNQELRSIYKEYKNSKYFNMLGISLDIDKKQWSDAIKRDTLKWEQVSDFAGLNSDIAGQFAIQALPVNILLSPEGYILAKNIGGEELKNEIKKAVAAKAEKEKANKTKK